MRQVNIREAKAHLSRLVKDVANGEEIVITKAGKPVARLIALRSAGSPRVAGALKGQICVAGDFDEPLPEEMLQTFEADDQPGVIINHTA